MKRIIIFIALTSFFNAYAQKLPNVQKVSLRAPANIKIDGKTDEWGGTFQAHNAATGISYSIANDDENLYVIIFSSEFMINIKMLGQGLNICFNNKEKTSGNGVTVKYPMGPENKDEYNKLGATAKSILFKDEQTDKEDNNSKHFKLSKALIAANKHVRILGANMLTDTVFSIYDAKGVMVSLNSQEGDLLCYELCIPLKYLGVSASSTAKIYYNVRLNEDFLSRSISPANRNVQPDSDEGTMMYATVFGENIY